MTRADPSEVALAGLTVVELGGGVAAPFGGRFLADLGAVVTKVEGTGGDPTRAWGPFAGDAPDPDASGTYCFLNAGKRAVYANLDDPSGRERVEALLAAADVLVEGVDAAERDRWDLGFDALAARHPHLVAVSVSPYGRTGAWAGRPGTDLTAAALSSLPLALGEQGREPLGLPFDQSDQQAGLHAVAAVLTALWERRRSGRGQGIDVATSQVMAYCVGGMHHVGAKMGAPWMRRGRLQRGTVYPTGFFEVADGYVCIASQTPKHWQKFLSLMGDPAWAKEGHAADAVYLGGVDASEAEAHFREWLKGYTRREFLEIAMENDLVCGEAQTVAEVLGSDQLAHRDFWARVPLDGTEVTIPKAGYLLSVTPTRVQGPAPARPDPAGAVTAAARPAPPIDVPRELALAGIRVLDFGWNWAGPMAAQLLADAGAEVIRVETRKRQDLMRFLDYTSWFFCHNNRSKHSITVNVTKPEGSALVRRLAPHVDVVMDNFSAGVMAKNGLGYDDLRAARPDIICVSLSMAGQTGPLRRMRGFAAIATAFSGLEALVGYPDGTPMGMMSFGLGDTTLAIQGVIGTLAALHHRARTGEGQFVDVSQIDSSSATMAEPMLDWQLNGRLPSPRGNAHSVLFPHGIFAARGDERWVALAVRDEGDWRALCSVIGQDGWGASPALATPAGRRRRDVEIDAAIADWCAEHDRDAAVETLVAAGVPAAPLLELPERNVHPHFVERGLVVPHEGGGFDPCTVYATPWLFSATPAAVTKPAPALGEDNEYVFKDVLGLPDAEYDALVEEGTIA